MASPFASITDDPRTLNTQAYTPDYSFLQQELGRSNQQYEQGLSQVKNDYSNIVNAPLTDNGNIQKRGQYISQIQEGLKKIATTDLSLPQNVTQAESLYAPFWKDTQLLQDMSWTKRLQNEYQKAEGARMSDKDDVRSSYDPASLGPLNDVTERLRNANRDPNVYKELTVPQWTPFINTDKHVLNWEEKIKPDVSEEDHYYTDEKGNIKYDPQHLITHHNGPKTLPAWYGMVSGIFGKEFDPQYNVLGSNLYNSHIKDYIDSHPGSTREEARQSVASQLYQPVLEEKKRHLDNVQASLADNIHQLDVLKKQENSNAKGLNPKQVELKKKLQDNIQNLSDSAQQANSDYIDFSKPDKISTYTDNYIISQLGDALKKQTINGYAKSLSQKTSSSVKTDQAYFDAQNINARWAEINETKRYHNISHEDNQADQQIKLLGLYADHPELQNSVSSQGAIPGSRVSSAGTNLLSNTPVYDIVQNERDADRRRVGTNLFGIPNVAGGATYGSFTQLLMNSDVGLTANELNALNKYQLQHHNGTLTHTETGQFIPASPQDGKLYNSAIDKIAKATGVDKKSINTPDKVTDAITQYGTSWVANNVHNQTDPDKVKYYSSLFNSTYNVYNKLKDDMDLQNREMGEKVAKAPDLYKPIAVPDNNGYHMITSRDVEPVAFDMVAKGEDGKTYRYSKNELASKYIHGNVEVVYPKGTEVGAAAEPYFKIDGVQMHPTRVAGRDYQQEFDMAHTTGLGKWYYGESHTNPEARADALGRFNEIQKRFGRSYEIGDALSRLAHNVIPHSSYYENQDGTTPTVITVDMTGKNAGNIEYVKDALATGNRFSVQDSKGNTINDDETISTLQKLANSKDAVKYLGTSFNAAVSDELGTNKIILDIGNIDKDDPYHKLSGNTYIIGTSPDTKSELLKKIPVAQDRERFDKLYSDNPDENKVYPSATYKAMGIDAVLSLAPDGHNFMVAGSYKDIDPATGKESVESIYLPIPRNNRAIGARQAFNDAMNKIAATHLSHINEYNTKHGVTK